MKGRIKWPFYFFLFHMSGTASMKYEPLAFWDSKPITNSVTVTL